ncbi:hypothetical protein AcW1_008527 [Taiwanofungus camphoratus]|nr:hypothetical protein AcW1_008527 [Antrodia cinnamomea]
MSSRRNRSRTKLCRNFALGHCPQGSQCKYLHTTAPLMPQNLTLPHLLTPFATQRDLGQYIALPVLQSPGQWMATTPSTQNSEIIPYNWTYPSNPYLIPIPAQHIAPTQFKPLSWRTALCRHFTKNKGWCPLGDECNYIHDLELAQIALDDVRFPSNNPNSGPSSSSSARINEGKGKAGTKHSHCWAYVQGLCHVKDCPYLHPVAVHHFVRHTPCLAWPNCQKGVLCPYKHPEPIIPKVPALPLSTESPARVHPPSPLEANLPGAYQYQGTTYFPLISQAPLSSLGAEPQPEWNHQYETWRPMLFAPPSSYEPPSPRTVPLQDRLIYEAEPIPVPAPPSDYAQEGLQSFANIPQPNFVYRSAGQSRRPSVTEDDEFPYVPPKNQRVGHARRISVTLKSKEDSDVLGLYTMGTSPRESWKTHGDRTERRSWAPSSSSVNAPSAPSPQRLYF